MPSDDVHTHALSTVDYYGLLEISPSAADNEIRRAYRKAALKYHPDKQGGSVESVDKFHTLQIAYDVLSDPAAREVYDNGRKAREAREERDRQLGDRRRKMKEDLERREGKRSREEVEEEERMEMKMRRLAADGARRRKELDEKRRAEAEREHRRAQGGPEQTGPGTDTGVNGGHQQSGQVQELERTIKIRFRREGASTELDKSHLEEFFKRYGAIEVVMVMKDKRKKLDDEDGKTHRKALVATAFVLYVSIASTYVAVEETPKAWVEVFGDNLESAIWANGEEPSYIASLRNPSQAPTTSPLSQDEFRRIRVRIAAKRQRETREAKKAAEEAERKEDQPGIRKVPSFASFKGPSTPLRPPPKVSFTPVSTPQGLTPGQRQKQRDDERRKLEAEIRAREAAEDQAGPPPA